MRLIVKRTQWPGYGVAALVALGLFGCNTNELGADKIAEAQVKAAPPTPNATQASALSTTTTADEKTLGLPFYSGAKPVGGTALSHSYGIDSALLETPDTPEKVLAFYKEQFPQSSATTDPSKTRLVSWSREKEGKAETIKCSISDPQEGNGLHNIEIKRVGNATQIHLIHMRADKAGNEVFTPETPPASDTKSEVKIIRPEPPGKFPDLNSPPSTGTNTVPPATRDPANAASGVGH